MRSRSHSFLFLAIVILAGCAEPKKPAAVEKASVTGSRFDAVGKITLHAGQPCSSQIMFDFRTTTSKTVWLAAPMHESKLLTQAANQHRKIHVSGKWRRGQAAGCNYVEISKVDPIR
jgi:hypothetical protein